MDRDLFAMVLAGAAVRVALMPPQDVEALVRGVLLGGARVCRWAALGWGTAGLRLESAYQQRVGV
jgi:hypothetical protein